jgi:hypothetical protein
MAEEKQVLINESTLQSMAETIREKKGLPSSETVQTGTTTEIVHHETKLITKYSHTDNIDDTGVATGTHGHNLDITDVVTIEGATELHVELYYGTENVNYDFVCVWEGDKDGTSVAYNYSSSISGKLGSNSANTFATATKVEYTITGDTVTFGFHSDSGSAYYGYYAIVTAELAEPWDEEVVVPVYEEIPVNRMLPSEMIEAVASLSAGIGTIKTVQKSVSKNSMNINIGKAEDITFPCFVYAWGYEDTVATSTTGERFGLIAVCEEDGVYTIKNFFPGGSYKNGTPFTVQLGKYKYYPASGNITASPATYYRGSSTSDTSFKYMVIYFE